MTCRLRGQISRFAEWHLKDPTWADSRNFAIVCVKRSRRDWTSIELHTNAREVRSNDLLCLFSVGRDAIGDL